ncbi:Cof-type HAD-IIB family hydrolase [Deinococcus aquiradiocola]|uniref:Hydrolase n=1 Tax=Deinococcus aquiradiocola TaxID=393059 RepID=A0A917PFW8_9DEIO|nr:HAD family hydrolase [Deinococcus aquiradiocola]GGJ75691.1 hydrolase [Deinococcus aquiradiocola]
MSALPLLIATDLDGTLLDARGEVSARNAAALRAAQAAGVVVVLVTGRPVRMVLPLARDLRLDGHVICSNGAATHRLPDGRAEDAAGIPPDVLRRVIGTLRAGVPGVTFALEYGDEVIRERALRDAEDSVTDILSAVQERPLLKLIVRSAGEGTHDLNRRINALCGEEVQASSSGATFSEVAAAGVDKGYALSRLCAQLGVPGSRVMAFGDAHNDLPMFAFAGARVAVGNAVPELRAAASAVTAAHDEDGVAVTIEALLGGA